MCLEEVNRTELIIKGIGGSAIESLSLTLTIFHKGFLLTRCFFLEKRRNICAATLLIVD